MSNPSFTTYRNPNSNRSTNTTDHTTQDLKGNIHESRRLQLAQFQLPEIQEKFNEVDKSDRFYFY
jgi:hypothetical protein